MSNPLMSTHLVSTCSPCPPSCDIRYANDPAKTIPPSLAIAIWRDTPRPKCAHTIVDRPKHARLSADPATKAYELRTRARMARLSPSRRRARRPRLENPARSRARGESQEKQRRSSRLARRLGRAAHDVVPRRRHRRHRLSHRAHRASTTSNGNLRASRPVTSPRAQRRRVRRRAYARAFARDSRRTSRARPARAFTPRAFSKTRG